MAETMLDLMYRNPVFIEELVKKLENPGEIIKLGKVSKLFNDKINNNNLVWYYALRKWYPNYSGSIAPYHFKKDYKRNFAVKTGVILKN